METVGYAALQVIPSMKGAKGVIEGELNGSLSVAGAAGGRSYGTSLLGTVGKFAKRATLITGAIVAGGVIKGGIDRALNIDSARAKLEGLGNDAKTVDRIMNSALKSVQGTAFGLDAAATTAAGAVAAGIRPGRELTKYLRLTADAATIAGVSMGELGSIMNKVQTGQVAYTEDLNMLADRGIPIYQWLQKEYGVTAVEFRKMVAAGKVDASTYRKVIQENIGGAAQSSGKTMRGTIANLGAAFSRLGANVVTSAFPQIKGGLKGVTAQVDALGPTAAKAGAALGRGLSKAGSFIKTFVSQMQTGTGAGGDFAKAMNVTADVLKLVWDVGTGVAGFLSDLPGPLKMIAIEAGLAAVVFPRLAGGITSATTAIGNQITYARVLRLEMAQTIRTQGLASAAMTGMTATATKLGGALKTAAGVGGMVAMTEGAKSTDKAMSTLMTAAGGAATGFAVGGPWGAAIGGAAGLLGGLVMATKKSGDAFKETAPPAADYASSLDQISGAATRATRAVAYQALAQSGAVEKAKSLGISQRDLVSATLGQEGAINRVNAAIEKNGYTVGVYTDAFGKTTVNMRALSQVASDVQVAIGQQGRAIESDVAKTKALALASGDLSKVLHGVPKDIRTKISQIGDPDALTKKLVNYVRQGRLVKPQIKTIISATGLDVTVKDIQRLAKVSKKTSDDVNKSSTDTGSAWAKMYGAGVTKGRGKVDMSLTGLINTTSRTASGKAGKKGQGVGSDMSMGVAIGIGQNGGYVNSAATTLINNALASMRAAADSHSPSRETIGLGGDIGDGLPIGMALRTGKVKKAAKGLAKTVIDGIRAGITDDASSVQSAMGDLTDKVMSAAKKMPKKVRKEWIKNAKAASAIAKSQGKLTGSLWAGMAPNDATDNLVRVLATGGAKVNATLADIANARQNLAGRLETAKQALADAIEAKESFKNSVADSVRSFTSLLNAEGKVNIYGFQQAVTGSDITALMKARLAKVKAFTENMAFLLSKGLNLTTYKELMAAGPEAAGDYAAALAANNGSVIGEINSLTVDITNASEGLGNTSAAVLYQQGVDSAAGLVAGLESQMSVVIAAAERLAGAITKAIKKALKIKSPSRVLAAIGRWVPAGLAVGIGATSRVRQVSVASTALAATAAAGVRSRIRDARRASSALSDALRVDMAPVYDGPTVRPPWTGDGPQDGTDGSFGPGARIQITTINPQAEPTSKTVDRAAQQLGMVGAFG
jgi:tape measure domain-containing protein